SRSPVPPRSVSRAALALALGLSTACAGKVARETTTPRTAEEQLLVSSAEERAVAKVDLLALQGRTVYVDDARLPASERPYVASAFAELCAASGAYLVRDASRAAVVVEVRAAAAALSDQRWVLTVPAIYVVNAVGGPAGAPEFIEVGRVLHEAWAKIDAFAYERATGKFLFGWRDAWGRAKRDITGTDVYPAEGIAGSLKERTQ
ncbi:MAG TPA: DUF6655 family protein, partial [Planctomycetota bacterium]|nr:DUF6655 family protein [Planctomycetota bacterium]